MTTQTTIAENRLKVLQNRDRLEIRIPIKKNIVVLVAMVLATLAWIFILFFFVRITLSLHFFWFKAGMIFSILIWFILGMAGASFIVWLFFGRERIIVTAEYLITDKPLVFFYRRNFYAINDISNIRTDKEIYQVNRNGQWMDESRSVVKFDTAHKFVTMARGVVKEEAEQIVLLIAKSPFMRQEQFAIEHRV